MPYKEDKLENDMLKDVSHADVAKDDEIIDDTDPNYDDYYDVSMTGDVNLSELWHLRFIFKDEGDFSEEEEDDTQEGETKPVKTDKKLAEDDDLLDEEYSDNEGTGYSHLCWVFVF